MVAVIRMQAIKNNAKIDVSVQKVRVKKERTSSLQKLHLSFGVIWIVKVNIVFFILLNQRNWFPQFSSLL